MTETTGRQTGNLPLSLYEVSGRGQLVRAASFSGLSGTVLMWRMIRRIGGAR